jgi:MarR family 2-MHQ and catechol resistance regulon transcriptional repressor
LSEKSQKNGIVELGLLMNEEFEKNKEQQQALNTWIKILRATETVSSSINKHLAADKLTISQFGVLEALYNLGPMCQRDVAAKILKSTANITTVVDNLEKREYLTRIRSREDRRYITLHLTDSGQQLMARIFPEHVKDITSALGILTLKEQTQLGKICKKLGMGNSEIG